MTEFETFLRWEEKSRDTIDFKKAYVDMAGDVIAGLMLSQIVYWYLPGQAGKTKLRVERDSHLWLVKSRDEWWEECRLTPREVDRARKVLESRNLVEVKLYKFNGSPTQHIRIREAEFVKAWQAVVQETSTDRGSKGGGGGPTGGAGEEPIEDTSDPSGERGLNANQEIAGLPPNPLKSPFSPNGEIHFTDSLNGFHQNRKMDFTKRLKPKTETTTEITTAAAREPPVVDAAAVSLVEELVGHGVGRTVANRLAREKPEMCRRCLEYLPYAKLRTTEGAWLANAIRDEYGPPQGYLAAKHREERQAQLRNARETENRRISHKDAIRSKKEARLREMLSQLERERGNAWAAFTGHLVKEREKVVRLCSNLTPERQKLVREDFETAARRLELFSCWLTSAEGRDLTMGENGKASPGVGPAGRISSCVEP
jgi:hypothetical protein